VWNQQKRRSLTKGLLPHLPTTKHTDGTKRVPCQNVAQRNLLFRGGVFLYQIDFTVGHFEEAWVYQTLQLLFVETFRNQSLRIAFLQVDSSRDLKGFKLLFSRFVLCAMKMLRFCIISELIQNFGDFSVQI